MRRILAIALLSTLALAAWSQPAQAGGPTSVLVTSPELGTATALYYQDTRYDALDSLLHEGALDGEPRPADGTYFNVTWLAHDVSVWRTDQVLVSESGAAWVATQMEFDEGPADNGRAWRQLAKGPALAGLLEDLGLLGGSPVAPKTPSAAPSSDASPVTAPAPARTPEVVTLTEWFSLAGWRWLAPGLLLGLGLGAVVARRRTRADESRHVLVDGPLQKV